MPTYYLSTPHARRMTLEAISRADPEMVVEIRSRNRSKAQNNYYWDLLNQISESLFIEGKSYTRDAWHLFFKQLFLIEEAVELPFNVTKMVTPTTTTLTTQAFSDFVEQVTAWAAENGVVWRDQNEEAA
jgi:hypothetical protein